MLCLNCNNDKYFKTVKEEETLVVKDEPITIMSNVTYCKKCNSKVWNNELEDNNLQKAYDIYKQRHNLLTSEQIIAIRESYGLTQRTFAKVIGLNERNLFSYELGTIQSTSDNNLILLSKNTNNFRTLYNLSKDSLTKEQQEEVSRWLNLNKKKKGE